MTCRALPLHEQFNGLEAHADYARRTASDSSFAAMPVVDFHRLGAVLLAVATAGAAAVPALAPRAAQAADASAWAQDSHSRLRLIAGTNPAGAAALRAGIEITMQPGWKTYWRYPGDSGLPPRFDFARSDNVAKVELLWPAPERFADGGGQSIGYRDRVILPLRVTPRDATQPVRLHLKADYAICARLCVPAAGEAELALLRGSSTFEESLAAAERRVPQPAALGAPGALAVRAVQRDNGGPRPRIAVDVVAPPTAAVDLFAEGPTPDWALPLPEREAAPAPGLIRFSFDLDGLPPGTAADGAELTLTLVAPPRAIEVKSHLD